MFIRQGSNNYEPCCTSCLHTLVELNLSGDRCLGMKLAKPVEEFTPRKETANCYVYLVLSWITVACLSKRYLNYLMDEKVIDGGVGVGKKTDVAHAVYV